MQNERMTPAEAAAYLGVSKPTLRRSLVDTGRLEEIIVTPRKRYYRTEDVVAILNPPRPAEDAHAGA